MPEEDKADILLALDISGTKISAHVDTMVDLYHGAPLAQLLTRVKVATSGKPFALSLQKRPQQIKNHPIPKTQPTPQVPSPKSQVPTFSYIFSTFFVFAVQTLFGFLVSRIYMEDSANSYPAEARNCCEQGERETSAWECAQVTESKPMEWTDEKHSLYLKSMEATFVNHLYRLLSQQSHKNFLPGSKLSRHKPTGICAPSGQYKVCRYGSWSKINFVREEPEVNQVEESGVLLANPWIRHYRSSERKVNRNFLSSCVKENAGTSANQSSAHNFFQLRREDSEDGNTEVTDQNFSDEDLEDEQEVKKTETPTGTMSNTDQVVPFENTVEDIDADVHGQAEG